MLRLPDRAASGTGAQSCEDFAIKEGVRLPGLGGDDASVAHGVLVDEFGAAKFRFTPHVMVAGHLFAAGEAGGRQYLYTVADGEDPFSGAVEGAQDVEEGLVVAQILGRAA